VTVWVVVAVVVVDRVGVVADWVLVTVFVVEAAVVLEVAAAAVAVLALVVVSAGAVGELALAVLLVICVRVFERLLAMLDAPPEPHPAARTARAPMNANLTRIDCTAAMTLTLVTTVNAVGNLNFFWGASEGGGCSPPGPKAPRAAPGR
jgi:hypothetical protein